MTHTPGPWTEDIKLGGPLTGVDASAATADGGEPFQCSQVIIPEISARIMWDSREPGRTERALADAKVVISAPALQAENERLRAALAEYGNHTFDCASSRIDMRDGMSGECDCGFNLAKEG